MATSLKSGDFDIITLRQIQMREGLANTVVPSQYILISDGTGFGYWNSVSSISGVPFDAVSDSYGSTLAASNIGHILPVSTIGINGLLNVYADGATSTLLFSNAAPNLLVAQDSVPFVSRLAAQIVPSAENITMSTSQSTLKFIGVGDIQLSTVTDLRTVFFSISSFTSKGYADLSSVARAWPGYSYSTLSTNAGYASFTSSIPYSTTSGGYGWDWSPSLGSNIPMSTVEQYPGYSTGDVYFSTVSFNMTPFMRYIQPNSTTKMFLEVNPNYMFQRMFLPATPPYNLFKGFSSFIQYQSARGVQILPTSVQGNVMTSQQSNAYSSNYFNNNLKLEIDPAVITSNAAIDGASVAYYTLYHRIPGGMASLLWDGSCDYNISDRGGFSNSAGVNVDNYTPRSNSVFLHVFNQAGNAPPMPGP